LWIFLIGGLVGGAFTGLGFVLLPYTLSDRVSRAALLLAFATLMVVAVSVVLVLGPGISQAASQSVSGGTYNPGPLVSFEATATLYDALEVIPYALFLFAYYRTFVRAFPRTITPTGSDSYVGSG
jgi:hypothetical protein